MTLPETAHHHWETVWVRMDAKEWEADGSIRHLPASTTCGPTSTDGKRPSTWTACLLGFPHHLRGPHRPGQCFHRRDEEEARTLTICMWTMQGQRAGHAGLARTASTGIKGHCLRQRRCGLSQLWERSHSTDDDTQISCARSASIWP